MIVDIFDDEEHCSSSGTRVHSCQTWSSSRRTGRRCAKVTTYCRDILDSERKHSQAKLCVYETCARDEGESAVIDLHSPR